MSAKHVPLLEQNQDTEETIGSAWLGALINPFFLFQGLTEVFASWFFTRPWRRMFLIIPVVAILMVAFGVILYGKQRGRREMTLHYASLAETELQRLKTEKVEADANGTSHDADAGVIPARVLGDQLIDQEKTSAYSDMLYRRLMQLDDQDARTRYMVGLQLVHSGRISQARQLMQEISPPGQRGFAPAHAWLAIDLLTRRPREQDGVGSSLTQTEQDDLMEHLREAVSGDKVSTALLSLYADLLLRQGQQTEAIAILSRAAQQDPSLRGRLAMVAKGKNRKLADESAADAIKALQATIDSGKPTPETYLELVALQLSSEQYKVAFDTAREGLTTVARDNDRLKLLSSEALRLMYRQSIHKSDKGVELNLSLLDAAIKEYPANPSLSAEIAMLADMGVEASPSLRSAMEEQLANGQATALAHLLLANQELRGGQLSKAIPHLEISLKQAPNQPVALNNLALALSLTNAGQTERAEQLIDRAIAIVPNNAEFYDTQGEIRLIAGRPLDAVASLERAIGINPSREHTHQLMVKAYRAAGLEEMAVVHETFLTKHHADSSNAGPPAANVPSISSQERTPQ